MLISRYVGQQAVTSTKKILQQ